MVLGEDEFGINAGSFNQATEKSTVNVHSRRKNIPQMMLSNIRAELFRDIELFLLFVFFSLSLKFFSNLFIY